MSDTARQFLAVCERNSSDAVELDYDARNPFDLCSITFTPIYRYKAALLMHCGVVVGTAMSRVQCIVYCKEQPLVPFPQTLQSHKVLYVLQREQVCGMPIHWSKIPIAMQWRTQSCWKCCKDRRRCVRVDVQSSPSSLALPAKQLAICCCLTCTQTCALSALTNEPQPFCLPQLGEARALLLEHNIVSANAHS